MALTLGHSYGKLRRPVGAGGSVEYDAPGIRREGHPRVSGNPDDQAATGAAARPRILFIEDELGLREAYQRFFARRFEVAVVETGAEARRQFDGFAPDLVVLDLKLPDTDGMDVLRALRIKRPDLRVIVTTSYASQQPVFEMLGIPHNGYLVKPFTLGELDAQISAALG